MLDHSALVSRQLQKESTGVMHNYRRFRFHSVDRQSKLRCQRSFYQNWHIGEHLAMLQLHVHHRGGMCGCFRCGNPLYYIYNGVVCRRKFSAKKRRTILEFLYSLQPKCTSIRIQNCFALIKERSAAEILADDRCRVQCSFAMAVVGDFGSSSKR